MAGLTCVCFSSTSSPITWEIESSTLLMGRPATWTQFCNNFLRRVINKLITLYIHVTERSFLIWNIFYTHHIASMKWLISYLIPPFLSKDGTMDMGCSAISSTDSFNTSIKLSSCYREDKIYIWSYQKHHMAFNPQHTEKKLCSRERTWPRVEWTGSLECSGAHPLVPLVPSSTAVWDTSA